MRADTAYFEKRASEEQAAASRAAHPRARRAHLELAARYNDLARAAAMDLNELFYQQQVERIRADAAPTRAARFAHEKLAQRYGDMIGQLARGKAASRMALPAFGVPQSLRADGVLVQLPILSN